MRRKPIEFDPRALEEARVARRWYARRSADIADRFLAQLDRTVDRIAEGPRACSAYVHGTRVARLGRFPYLLVFREADDVIQVIARMFHTPVCCPQGR